MRITFPNILGGLGWHMPQRQLSVTYCSPQLRSWKALPKKEDPQAGSIWNEISINQTEKIPECMSLSQCYLQLVPLELLITSFAGWKFRTWYVLRWSQMPRIGLVGAATFHWFDVACDRNARRKCSFATFGGVGWWCWWVQEPWFQTSPNFSQVGDPNLSKSKLQNLFFRFGHRPNLHAISILWQQLRFTQDMPVYRVHEAKPGQFGGHRKPIFIFSPLIPFSKLRISKWKYVLLGIEQSYLYLCLQLMAA